jgi:hypothetical protein
MIRADIYDHLRVSAVHQHRLALLPFRVDIHSSHASAIVDH